MRTFFLCLTTLAVLSIALQSPLYCRTDQTIQPPEDSSSYFLGASVGLNDFHQQDRYLSPGIYNGVMFSSALSFSIKAENFRHEADVRFSYGHPSIELARSEMKQYAVCLDYSFLYNAERPPVLGNPLEFSIGAGLSSAVMNTNLNSKDQTSAYTTYDQSWYWSHSLNLLVAAEYMPAEDKQIFAKLTLPVFSLVSRPENGHWLNEDNSKVIHDNFLNAALQGKAEWPWNNFAMQLDLEYRQALNRSLDLSCRYIFSYASSDRPLAMGMYMNHFLLGLGWKF